MKPALLFLFMAIPLAHSQEITVAAAADLTNCIPVIDAAFQKANPGAMVKVSFGSSGNIFAEIRNGAPFDVFLSADIKYPETLAMAGLAEAPVKYAQGRLVLWTMNGALDLSRGLAALRDPAVKHIALANPDHAPYGRAAKAALENEKLWDELTPKFVYGESIAQTAQFVQTGNADAGLIAMSLVIAPRFAPAGHFYEIPAADYPALDQAAALTKAGAGKPLARAYIDFLKSDEARKILEEFGFRLPK
jgi:molybdate transport system substrate-binding protein